MDTTDRNDSNTAPDLPRDLYKAYLRVIDILRADHTLTDEKEIELLRKARDTQQRLSRTGQTSHAAND